MAKPNSRATFKAYCLRKLGDGVIDINMSDEQIEDRIDEALSFWYDYSSYGSQKIFYKHEITDQDILNKKITLPENIIGAVRIFDLGYSQSGIANPFNIGYQIALNDLQNLSSFSLIPYYVGQVQLNLIEQMLVGQKPIRFNRYVHELSVDMNWAIVKAGNYLLVEAYDVIDPEVYVSAYGDRTLQNYATALIKRNWATNLSKYAGMELPGGLTVNAEEMTQEADGEIEKYEAFIMGSNLPQAIYSG
jgi:hypothetical protein